MSESEIEFEMLAGNMRALAFIYFDMKESSVIFGYMSKEKRTDDTAKTTRNFPIDSKFCEIYMLDV